MGWHNLEGSGNAEHTMTNGIMLDAQSDPVDNTLENLFAGVGADHGPAGASQWTPVDCMRPRRRMRISRAR
jgi:catalase-peroxidase